MAIPLANEFKIGLTQVGMAYLKNLTYPLKMPLYEYVKSSGIEENISSVNEINIGTPITRWHWGFLTALQRTQLRTFCSGRSASVFIRTPDDTETFQNYSCVMIWSPQIEDRQATRIIDFTIEFRNLVLL